MEIVTSIGRSKECVNQNISEFDLAYIAGFVDGEGTITIQAVKRPDRCRTISHRPVLSIHNTCIDVLEWIKMIFGVGRIHRCSQRIENRKIVYKYAITCSNAINVARMLLPYLRVKRMQAEILIKFSETLVTDYSQTHKKLTNNVMDIRSGHTDAIQAINRRGFASKGV